MKNSYSGKKVIVTGGAGFIGSHLVEALVAQGAEVTVIDSLITGSLQNLSAIASKITFVEDSICDQKLCEKELQGAEYVFHLAAQVSVPESMQDPTTCFATNIQGTFTLLEAARINKVQRFVFSSSCAVYGNQSEPCVETMPCAPTSPYAYSKYIGEQLCEQYSRCFSLPTVCLRYFNVVGERQNPYGPYAGVMAQFKDRMLKNEPVTIFGDGSQSRDFVPVAQVVQANMNLALLPTKQCTGSPVNIATGKSRSVNELFYELKKELNYLYEPEYKPARPGDIVRSEANCNKLKRVRLTT